MFSLKKIKLNKTKIIKKNFHKLKNTCDNTKSEFNLNTLYINNKETMLIVAKKTRRKLKRRVSDAYFIKKRAPKKEETTIMIVTNFKMKKGVNILFFC